MTYRLDPPRPLCTPEQARAIGERMTKAAEEASAVIGRAAPAFARATLTLRHSNEDERPSAEVDPDPLPW